MKLFRASQSSVVHIEAVLTSNQSPVWPAKIFQRFTDTVVCKRCLSQSFIHQSTSCAKKPYKSSSLLRDFNCFLTNHTVGCCNINFSCLSEIRRKNLLCKQCLYIFVVLFCVTAVVSIPRLANFSPCDPVIFFVLASLSIPIACWKTKVFLMFMGNYWERNRERETFKLNRFPIVGAKINFLHCSVL